MDALLVCSLCAASVPEGLEGQHRRWHLEAALGLVRPQVDVHGLSIPEASWVPVGLGSSRLAFDGQQELVQVEEWLAAHGAILIERDVRGASGFLPTVAFDRNASVAVEFGCELSGEEVLWLFVAVLGETPAAPEDVAIAQHRIFSLQADLAKTIERR